MRIAGLAEMFSIVAADKKYIYIYISMLVISNKLAILTCKEPVCKALVLPAK